MLMHVLVSMGVSVALVLLFGILLVFKPSPWYDVRLILPAVALFLSNAISSISIGLSSALTQLTTGTTSYARVAQNIKLLSKWEKDPVF